MKHLSLLKITLTVVVMAVTAPLVNADEATPKNLATIMASSSTSNQFEQLDLNKDNSLSLVETEEYKQIHDAFTQIDLNNDAAISKEELEKFIK